MLLKLLVSALYILIKIKFVNSENSTSLTEFQIRSFNYSDVTVYCTLNDCSEEKLENWMTYLYTSIGFGLYCDINGTINDEFGCESFNGTSPYTKEYNTSNGLIRRVYYHFQNVSKPDSIYNYKTYNYNLFLGNHSLYIRNFDDDLLFKYDHYCRTFRYKEETVFFPFVAIKVDKNETKIVIVDFECSQVYIALYISDLMLFSADDRNSPFISYIISGASFAFIAICHILIPGLRNNTNGACIMIYAVLESITYFEDFFNDLETCSIWRIYLDFYISLAGMMWLNIVCINALLTIR